MSSTSKKHQNFISEPMREKSVTELAGIGDVLGKRLADEGLDKAYTMLGVFLVMKRNRELFIHWLKYISGANNRQASVCYDCLSDWCDQFL